MLTSRAEHRLTLRPETAPDRLTAIAFDNGLVPERLVDNVEDERRERARLGALLDTVRISCNPASDAALIEAGLAPASKPMTAAELLRRPEASAASVARALSTLGDHRLAESRPAMLADLEIDLKYRAFIARADREAVRSGRHQTRVLASDIDFAVVPGLRREARDKLTMHRPESVAHAKKLAGVTPSDVAALLIYTRRTLSVQPE